MIRNLIWTQLAGDKAAFAKSFKLSRRMHENQYSRSQLSRQTDYKWRRTKYRALLIKLSPQINRRQRLGRWWEEVNAIVATSRQKKQLYKVTPIRVDLIASLFVRIYDLSLSLSLSHVNVVCQLLLYMRVDLRKSAIVHPSLWEIFLRRVMSASDLIFIPHAK